MKRAVALLLCLVCLLAGSRALAEEKERETLALGSRGEAVSRLQRRLLDLGFYLYKPTGSYQAVTRRAVLAFEQAAGARQDGRLTPEEQDLLFSGSAPRAPFVAAVPLTFTAQGAFTVTGELMDWSEAKALLVPGEAYQVVNCATGESCELVYVSGEGHAHMTPGPFFTDPQTLKKWLGETNSGYKVAVVVSLEGRRVAASLQYDNSIAHVYFQGSVSHVLGLEDKEHDSLILRAAGR